MTNNAQIQANRSNAAKSTGPRSDQGKAASSANALKHGAYACRPLGIPRGQFAEDDDEVADFVDQLIASLAPRDGVEIEMAQRIGIYLLRFRRLSRLEAEAIAGDSPTRSGYSDVPDYLNPAAVDGDATREVGALRALVQSMSQVTLIDARTASGLEKALAVYERLQQRTMPTADNDET